MTLEEYAEFVRSTNTTEDGTRGGLDYALMKLCAEAGEVAQLRAREILSGTPSAPLAGGGDLVRRARYALELGDLAWYLVETCDLLDLTVEQVLMINRVKLEYRRLKNRDGTLRGKDPVNEQMIAECRLQAEDPFDADGFGVCEGCEDLTRHLHPLHRTPLCTRCLP